MVVKSKKEETKKTPANINDTRMLPPTTNQKMSWQSPTTITCF